MSSPAAIQVEGVTFHYGPREALGGIDFAVRERAIYGLLGPNGGGKTTLFRLLSTLLPLQGGHAEILGHDLRTRIAEIRALIGVTFQSPSLDRHLTVQENLRHQGHLYGLSGKLLRARIELLAGQLGVAERLNDRVQTLSGGLQRRVEIAKGLLHAPRLLLLDEPSTGLDPGARIDLWQALRRLRDQEGVTLLVTTHLMEEAESCDHLGILHRGQLVGDGSPDELRATVGGDCLTLRCDEPAALARDIQMQFGCESRVMEGSLRIEQPRGHELLRDLAETFSERFTSISLGKPTLEDVFIQRTGHQFWEEQG